MYVQGGQHLRNSGDRDPYGIPRLYFSDPFRYFGILINPGHSKCRTLTLMGRKQWTDILKLLPNYSCLNEPGNAIF